MPLYNSPLGAAQAGVDGIMFGFTNNPSENFDAFLVTSIRDFLFREGEEENGLDLMALNIQRGRDHGIGCEYDYSPFVIRPNFYTPRFLYTIVCLTGYPQDMYVAIATHGPQACTLYHCVPSQRLTLLYLYRQISCSV